MEIKYLVVVNLFPRVLASAITLECDQKTISGSQSMTTDIIIGKLAVDENLYDETVSNSKMPYSQTKVSSPRDKFQ